jgi:hypothetical protein
VYPGLKAGVALFIGKVLYELVNDPGFESSFMNDFVQVVALIGFLFITVVLFALSAENFSVLGFFLVMIFSAITILRIVFFKGSLLGIPENLLLIFVSLYFIVSSGREPRKHHH